MAEEEGIRSRIPTTLKGYIRETPFFCKIIELLFCVIATGLIVDPFNERMQSNINHIAVIYIALCGYIMINAILILCYLLGEKLGKKTALFFSGLGGIMCLTAGILLIHDWKNFQNNFIRRYQDQYLAQMLSSGIFAILAAIIFAIETFFTYKYE